MKKQALFESLGLTVLYVVVQLVSYFAINAVFERELGSLLAWTTFVTAVVMTLLLLIIAKIYGRTLSYFGYLQAGKLKDWAISLGLLVVFWVLSELLGRWLDKTPMDFMDAIVSDGGAWLIVVVVVVAPIYEELLFRGAIFGRLYQPKTVFIHKDGEFWLAGAISGLLFALVHMQYDWFGLVMIFALAYILAWARAKTGGLILPIALHLINNAVAMAVYLWG